MRHSTDCWRPFPHAAPSPPEPSPPLLEVLAMFAYAIRHVSQSLRMLGLALAIALAGLGALQVEAAHAETAGIIYVADGGADAIMRVDPSKPNGSNQTVLSAGQNFKNPRTIALAANGL